jgi:hypothetical protein
MNDYDDVQEMRGRKRGAISNGEKIDLGICNFINCHLLSSAKKEKKKKTGSHTNTSM